MDEFGLRHTQNQGPWTYCMRCDKKVKIAKCTWQRGLLLGPECVDVKLLGDREPKIAAVLTDGKEEYVPVEKLRNPDLFNEEEDFLI